jgi:hypothetical protein
MSVLSSSSSALVSFLPCEEPSRAAAARTAEPSKKLSTTSASAAVRALVRETMGE